MPPPHAIVTGSSSGIGLAVAHKLLASGWGVTGLDIAATADANLSHANYQHVRLDLADVSRVRQVAVDVLASGTPYALVHAAGIMHAAPLGQLQADVGAHLWALHVQAATVLANALLPAMQMQKQGRLVLIGSRVAHGMAGRSQYAASKAALVSLARSWAAEVVADGVTVNVVSPAATDTPMLQASSRATSTPRLPHIGRLIQPEEVAALVLYLLSPEAAAITGQEIQVCGGASLDF